MTGCPVPIGDRYRALRREADRLEQEAHADLMRRIATSFAAKFSAPRTSREDPALQAACRDAGVHSAFSLGKWLRSWCGAVCRQRCGWVWRVDENDYTTSLISRATTSSNTPHEPPTRRCGSMNSRAKSCARRLAEFREVPSRAWRTPTG